MLKPGTVVECATAGWEEGVITGAEQPWLPSGDDTYLYEVKLYDGRIAYATDTQLSVELGTESEIAARAKRPGIKEYAQA